MNDELSAGERRELRELFRARLDDWLEGAGAPADAHELESLTLHALLHFQDAAAPEGVAEDAVAELEARGDEAAASILAVAGLLLAPPLAEPAQSALGRLRAGGIEVELPAGTGELELAHARRHDHGEGSLHLALLARPGADRVQLAAIAVERGEDGEVIVGGSFTEPVEPDEAEALQDDPPGLPEDNAGIPISADELHAALRDALARNLELALPVEHGAGVGLPLVWRAVGGEPAELDGLSVLPPGESLEDALANEGLMGEDLEGYPPEPRDERFEPTPPPSLSLPYIALDVGRNDPCPCGSGSKAKRCCQARTEDLRRQVAAVEDLVIDLADLAWERCPSCYERAFAELFQGGSGFFGHGTARLRERLEAALWIVCDGELCEGTPGPLERRLSAAADDPGARDLAASELRVWRLVRLRGAGLIEARCALSDAPVELEAVRPPSGEAAPGRLLVARSLPRPGGRFALLGRPPVVEEDAEPDFERLLEEVRAASPEPAEAGRSRGPALLSAALCWMEERQHTAEGELVAERHLTFSPVDVPAAAAALDAEPDLERAETLEEDLIAWEFRGSERQPSPASMPRELGVRWVLCEEDRCDPPVLASIELRRSEAELWLFAPSERRVEAAERTLRSRLGRLLGEVVDRYTDYPDTQRRWQRESVERVLAAE